jgi:hypothetical protein
MFTRYSITVSFIALAVAYGSSLLVGWSLAQQVPGVRSEDQMLVLARSAAIAVIAWPLWFVHWRWAKRDWLWESSAAQYYLAFFTISGLVASVWIGAQFLTRMFEVLFGARMLDNETMGYLLGSLWSTLFSLWLWIYHGAIWLQHRRRVVA